MVRAKSALAVSAPGSRAVTLRLRLPAALVGGVPLKVRVWAAKASQVGKESPLARLAL